MIKNDEEKLRDQFRLITPELYNWGKYVDEKLNAYASKLYPEIKEIVQIPANNRVKDVESFISKAFDMVISFFK